ncbi:MAG: Ca-activated chloride channel family protein [Hyphomicrobiaceae bacterium]|jgi:Ca-activated chloride channel family protein
MVMKSAAQQFRTLGSQAMLVSVLAALSLCVLTWQERSFAALWLTPDQWGRLAYEKLDFAGAAEQFEDPSWKGVASYEAGQYTEAAAAFGRVPTPESFYNRGNAFMKSREYRKAITGYEQAVAESSSWTDAAENLELARHVLIYIEGLREQTDTGDETELGADDIVFDNTEERGKEIVITQESTILAESAEKWMRSVDTETRDFLRGRFLLEASRRGER